MAPAKRALSALGHVRIDAPELINVEADDSAPVAGHVESVPMDQADPALVGGSPGAVYARGSAKEAFIGSVHQYTHSKINKTTFPP